MAAWSSGTIRADFPDVVMLDHMEEPDQGDHPGADEYLGGSI